MYNRALSQFFAVFLVLALSKSGSAFDFDLHAGWSDQLFPSFIVSTATIKLPDEPEASEQLLGDSEGLFGVTVTAEEDDTPVEVTISCNTIMEPSSFSGTLAEAGESYTIQPKIRYKYDELLKHHQPGPVTITVSVTLGDDESETSRTLTLRSINDCPYTVVKDEVAEDISFVFAAYVNEDHPFVDKLLREGLDTGIVDSFSGYQAEDKADVYRQVYALWHALSKRDVRYSNITTTAAESESISSQHVRLIDESINNAQANCVDGSVLLASLLRKIGIEPVLVMVPGHCYLAFQVDAEGKEIVALETTLLGTEADSAMAIEGTDNVVEGTWLEENSWKTFTAALAIGKGDFDSNQDNFKSSEDPDYQLIPIGAARKLGILPIAFRSDDDFVPVANDQFADDDAE